MNIDVKNFLKDINLDKNELIMTFHTTLSGSDILSRNQEGNGIR